MPRNPQPVEPTSPEDTAELNRRLQASEFSLTSLFGRPGNRMSDPDVLAAAASITRRPLRRRPAVHTEPQTDDNFPEAMRRHLDGLNRQFAKVSEGLAQLDLTLAEVINRHLADRNHQTN